MPPRSRSRRQKGRQDEPQWQPVQWPLYSEHRRLQQASGVTGAQQAAAAARAALLVTEGWGALEDWLLDPRPHHGEPHPRQQRQAQQHQQHIAFD